MSALDSDIQELRTAIEQDDLYSLITYGLALVNSCGNQKPLDIVLGAVKKNPIWNEGGTRKSMLDIFGVFGNTGPLIRAYRAKLSNALF